ncbi:ParB N-terminal domain-containing protein [Micromonospora sp. STR1s_5]|nr:ParB N-terminal domain-containing protein [Micromonospora sp. STR1s_5]
MRPISTEGFEPIRDRADDPAPILQWIKVTDLVVDPAYQRPIIGEGRRNVDRIARDFRWSYFAPVVVAPVEGGKFAIIDGQHRTTAAAVVGIESVPCQVVIAPRHQQAAAFKAINGATTPINRMALHAAALVAKEPAVVELTEACTSAGVELLRYPVPLERQSPGQTMAIGALAFARRRYGRDTLVAALRCFTRSSNNRAGALTARMIKAVCEVLHRNPSWQVSGIQLLAAVDKVDFGEVEKRALAQAAREGLGRLRSVADALERELAARLRRQAAE